MTLHFIRRLLKASRSEQDRFFSQQIPLSVFKTHEPQIRWVYEYRTRHGVYPSVLAFRSRFPGVELPKSSEPLGAIVSTIVDSDLFEQLSEMVKKGETLYKSGRNSKDIAEFFRRSSHAIRLYDASFVDSGYDPRSVLKKYREMVIKKSKGIIRPPSPWPTLNDLIGTFLPGEVAVIAARTSLGKTWMTLSWAHYLESTGERVLVISKELPTPQVLMRWTAIHERLNYHDLRHGTLSPKQLRRFAQSAVKFNRAESNLLISGTELISGVGFSQIIQKIQEFSPTVLVVDGAYLIYPEEKFPNDQQRFAYCSAMLRRISGAHGLKSILVVQAKREAEAETISGVTKAALKDIYGADNWAQDADFVLLINGKRGAPIRTVHLDKGRESDVGSWVIDFKLSPYPIFREIEGMVEKGAVKFQGIE